jgi:hypothetical protein
MASAPTEPSTSAASPIAGEPSACQATC